MRPIQYVFLILRDKLRKKSSDRYVAIGFLKKISIISNQTVDHKDRVTRTQQNMVYKKNDQLMAKIFEETFGYKEKDIFGN